jgi:multidrug transporter EmrE-like cation transporter
LAGIQMRAWVYLGLAIVAEVIATSALKSTAGFSRPTASTVVELIAFSKTVAH